MRHILWLLGVSSCLLAQQSVRYELRFPNAVHHEAEIRAVFSGVDRPVLEVVMSRSSPGRYALHEFAKNVYNFRATDEQGRALTIGRPNSSGWNISGHHRNVIVEYTLYGDRCDGTYAAIDETHAHLNLPATLVWAHGFEHAPSTLKFDLPGGSNWAVATQLTPQADGSWLAPDLEWLMDSPVEISAHSILKWKVEDATFRLALHYQGSAEEANALAEKCKAIVLEEEGVFGSFPKYDNGAYTFLIDFLPYASFDGMEHRNSAIITETHDPRASNDFFIESISHEFFHSWNVKRIRPRSLEPFDFERANMSGELWFGEGFTQYYGVLVLRRAGLSTIDQLLQEIGSAVNTVLTAPGRNVFDVIDMSRRAPFVDAATSIDPNNNANTYISYYTYGEALALGIDLAIRERFPGKSLDDWMRTMWREHPDIDRPYTLEDLERTLAETTGDARLASSIFEHNIRGREAMNYRALLASAGLLLRPAQPNKPWLGREQLSSSHEALELTRNTVRGSPLYRAGLERGDRILACDGKPTRKLSDLDACLEQHAPGSHLQLAVETRSGERVADVTVEADPLLQVMTYEQAGLAITPEMKALRDSWLASKALHPLPRLAVISEASRTRSNWPGTK